MEENRWSARLIKMLYEAGISCKIGEFGEIVVPKREGCKCQMFAIFPPQNDLDGEAITVEEAFKCFKKWSENDG